MPLKLNVGLSRKIGLPDYGSMGASCHVELELDASLFQRDLNAFHQQVHNAYVACSQAVGDELARQRAQNGETAETPTSLPAPPPSNTSSGNGNSNGSSHNASRKQLDYLQQLARQWSS